MREILRRAGFTGWRRHQNLPGRPDFIFRRFRVAIFVDGCFWHQCPRCSNMPVNNSEFWRTKLTGNRTRDKQNNQKLRQLGWIPLRFWEHELEDAGRVIKKLSSVLPKERFV
jgi:DNA mismatch endonuclease (patch repair protein)